MVYTYTDYNLDGVSVTELIEPYLDIVLEDDDTPFGGTAFTGETVRDFIQSFGTELHNCTPEELDSALVECGIRPVMKQVNQSEF